MSDIKLGHRIYYFVNPDNLEAIYSTEAYSAAEASIIIGQVSRVTATRLIDVTDYSE
jgi:hypothetical protein